MSQDQLWLWGPGIYGSAEGVQSHVRIPRSIIYLKIERTHTEYHPGDPGVWVGFHISYTWMDRDR